MSKTIFPENCDEYFIVKGKGDGYGFIEDDVKEAIRVRQIFEAEALLKTVREINYEV